MSVANVPLDAIDSVIANDYHDASESIPLPLAASDSGNDETDALEAVKLDPAVLEAQITLDRTEPKLCTSMSGAASFNVSDGGSPSLAGGARSCTASTSGSVPSRPPSAASAHSLTTSDIPYRPTSAASLHSQTTSGIHSRPTSSGSARSRTTSTSSSGWESAYERVLSAQQAALDTITPEQLGLLLRYVATLRRQRQSLQKTLECAFCKNNGETFAWYSSHALKDWRGRVLCPVLRAFRCPRCGATGDRAHTIKYCQDNQETDVFAAFSA